MNTPRGKYVPITVHYQNHSHVVDSGVTNERNVSGTFWFSIRVGHSEALLCVGFVGFLGRLAVKGVPEECQTGPADTRCPLGLLPSSPPSRPPSHSPSRLHPLPLLSLTCAEGSITLSIQQRTTETTKTILPVLSLAMLTTERGKVQRRRKKSVSGNMHPFSLSRCRSCCTNKHETNDIPQRSMKGSAYYGGRGSKTVLSYI